MKKKAKSESVDQYTHSNEKRPNNPPVGLVTPGTDPDQPSKKYSYDPRLDPQLQWSGKQENSEFEVDTVSLHVHERIDPLTILEKAMKPKQSTQQTMFNYFETPGNNPPLREAIDFYKHDQNWSNRLIAGDSLLVMNSLLEKEGMEGKVQMIYMDPPYGIKYGSNFQPFVNKRDVKDGKDEDLTQEPEMIKAFRDTWQLGIHSYLSYLRNRLFLSHRLLTDSGSIFIQISNKNMHLIRIILDEIFNPQNFCGIIYYKTKASPQQVQTIPQMGDFILWYAKNKQNIKVKNLYIPKQMDEEIKKEFGLIELENGEIKHAKELNWKIPNNSKIFRTQSILTARQSEDRNFSFEIAGRVIKPPINYSWAIDKKGMNNLLMQNRLLDRDATFRLYKQYFDDFPYVLRSNLWLDAMGAIDKIYAVQTSDKIIQNCVLMTTDPGDLILDPTCGSGTTAFVAEQTGRRWLTCDSSRVSITITKKRLMTSIYPYYKLKSTSLKDGFIYKEILRKSLKTIASKESPEIIILYDEPKADLSKKRISGPFTVEAVPSPIAKSLDVLSEDDSKSNSSISTNNKNSQQEQWRDELLKTGIRAKAGQKIEFSRVETHPATKWLHADAETKEDKPKRVMISFGPEHAPLEQRQVALAIEEAQTLVPKPKMIIFAAMQFDPEAAKDIDELSWPDVTMLKVEMNKDLLTADLKKKRVSNESFWLMGQPDVELRKTKDVKYIITVNGFDYYNTRTGEVESGSSSKIAMWMLDTDYDGRSVYPQQVFFPMEEKTGGWSKLAKTLQAQIDEELITKYQGTESIPFEAGSNKRAAVKIIDDRGIESLKIIRLE